jgi:nicotinate phosphoribosyltransferase
MSFLRATAGLLTDRYQLTMAESYLAQGIADEPVAYELFVRELPRERGYLVAAGLEQVVEYLTGLTFEPDDLAYLRESGTCTSLLCQRLSSIRFDGDLDAVAEGTVVHANEPLLRVEGGRLICQIVESMLLNLVNFETLVASKAARVISVAGGRPCVDFGYRRAHGPDAGLLAARAAYAVGFAGTATVAAGRLWGIPTVGTMAHSYVMSFADEVSAFCAFLHDQPGDVTLLVDTYDTLRGAQAAVDAARRCDRLPAAVRLDSGDVGILSRGVRQILDAGGLRETQIFVSGDLDEHSVESLMGEGAPIDGFGVGTRLVTSYDVPALGGIYKLVESNGMPVMKIAGRKTTLPGRHQVFRDRDGDTLGLVGEALAGTPLLQPVLRGGEPIAEIPTLDSVRERAAGELADLPPGLRRLKDPSSQRPRLSPRLRELKERLT